MEEQVHSERAAGLLELQQHMDTAIRSLPDKEQTVLRSFYGLDGRPKNQKEVLLYPSCTTSYSEQLHKVP